VSAVLPGEIELEHASRAFRVRGERGATLKEVVLRRRGRRGGPPPVRALDDVTLHVAPGETLGIVGRNGAGKSSILRVLAGIVPLDSGRAECGGEVVTLLELGAGFGRDFTGRENIYLNGALHGLSRAQVEARMEEIVAFSELGDFVDMPVRTYSSGMLVRLGFSIAAHLDADVMLIDEVLAVGDEAFQRKCLTRISERIEAGVTLVLVSHAPGAIERVCDRVVVLDAGRVAFDGPAPEALLHYHRMLGTEHGAGAALRAGPADRVLAVTEVELQDGDGRTRHVFHSGEAMRVVFTVLARGPSASPQLALEFRDQRGNPVFNTSRTLELDGAGAQLVLEISHLALLGGDYDLVCSAHEADDPDPGIDRLAGFSVADEPGVRGVADLRGTWTAAEPVRVAT
jgi:ABC-type polysaccharide/polyol phosphate transport system ATPase subunit